MSNQKIGITAEFAALIKSERDSKYDYFISERTRKIHIFFSKMLPGKSIRDIFNQRLALFDAFDKKIQSSKADQLIELACGFSLRGFDLCLRNPNIIYIDSDFEKIIKLKLEILKEICGKKNIIFPQNYKLVEIDVLKDNIFKKTADLIFKDKKTILVAEGLTSYFNNKDFEKFLKNIRDFLDKTSDSECFFTESSSANKGTIFKLLRYFVSLVTLNRSHKRNLEILQKIFENNGISNFKIEESEKNIFVTISN